MSLLNAAEQVLNLARRLEGITELARELQKIGSMQNAAAEAQGKLEAHRRDLAEVEAELATARNTHTDILADAEKRAAEIVAAADARAQQRESEAQAAAKVTTDAARKMVARLTSEHQELMATYAAEEQAAQAASAVEGERLADLQRQVREAQETLAAVQANARATLEKIAH